MNVQDYIDSGILYDYSIGALSESERAGVDKVCAQYPEIKYELRQLQKTIEEHVAATAVSPVAAMQDAIWSKLDNINREKTGNIRELPVLNKYSDYNNWKRIVVPFMPVEPDSDRIVKTIREEGGVTQMLIISKTDVEEEIHIHEQESFIILEGECECHIGDDVYRLGPGSFIEIPLYTRHNVRVLSPYVVAVLQHSAI
jgi:mannose-6-phosphate isomerase-like protein (cupin superfamily)